MTTENDQMDDFMEFLNKQSTGTGDDLMAKLAGKLRD